MSKDCECPARALVIAKPLRNFYKKFEGKAIGIDLGVSKPTTGIAMLRDGMLITMHESELCNGLEGLLSTNGIKVVSIDAPLSLPHGRKSIAAKSGQHFRECDLKLRALGIKFLPITLGAMRKLTAKGMELVDSFRSFSKAKPIETYPGAVYDLFRVSRKSPAAIRKFLLDRFGIITGKAKLSSHELDAIVCLMVAIADIQNKSLSLKGRDGAIYLVGKGFVKA